MNQKWTILKDLRKNFLQLDPKATQDYWQSGAALSAYDETFARRIRWKWDAVLTEFFRTNISIPNGPILDFGCGTAVASEALCDVLLARSKEISKGHSNDMGNALSQGPDGGNQDSVGKNQSGLKASRLNQNEAKISTGQSIGHSFVLHDRSPLAMNFAQAKIDKRGFEAKSTKNVEHEKYSTVLASHVLTELDEASVETLVKILRKSEMFILVDAGIPAVSKRLIAIRELFLEAGWHVQAPCTHHAACPLKTSQNDWCHFHVTPPSEVFTESFWAEFSSEMGIDIRALSTSYLVMSKKIDDKPKAKRLIGSPKSTKFGLRAFFCGEDGFNAFDLRRSKSEGKKILKNPFSVIVEN